MNINKSLLPVKAHYFFFMAAVGPILPQMNVFGKQLGISAVVMGSVTGVLPIMFLLAKPLFGYIADRYRQHRKSIFIGLVSAMGIFYALLYFVPEKEMITRYILCEELTPCDEEEIYRGNTCNLLTCEYQCGENKLDINISAIPSIYKDTELCLQDKTNFTCSFNNCTAHCKTNEELSDACTLSSLQFWLFVVLMSAGTIGFNVVNSISDAICFDVLGDDGQMSYGKQRVWGTIGFGISALVAGFAVNNWSIDIVKSFTPALIIMLMFLGIDVICCYKLQLPVMEAPKNILKDVFSLMHYLHIRIFMCFAALAGVVDGFIVYFLFWYLEDLALNTGHMENIKLLEGIIVAVETLGGELVFFPLSGAILERIGFGNSFSICFVNYALRLGLLSIIPNPWWAIAIEFFFQGPTYAMCYTTIVAYASAISPPGTSATMQGIVAGIDDGFGYAIGSILSGVLISVVGGKTTLQIFSTLALICGIVHAILYKLILQNKIPRTTSEPAEYQSPEDAAERQDSLES